MLYYKIICFQLIFPILCYADDETNRRLVMKKPAKFIVPPVMMLPVMVILAIALLVLD